MSTLMLQMMGSFAQFERSMILKRQAEGIAVAKAGPDAKEKYAGRKASIDRDVISKMIKAGSSLTSIAKSWASLGKVSTASKQSWGCDHGYRVPSGSEHRIGLDRVCSSESKTKI